MCRVLLVYFLAEEIRNDVMEVFDVIIEGWQSFDRHNGHRGNYKLKEIILKRAKGKEAGTSAHLRNGKWFSLAGVQVM